MAASSSAPGHAVEPGSASWFHRFLASESAGGMVLVAVAAFAFLWANSPWAWLYEALRSIPTGVQLGAFSIEKPLTLWVTDLLMAVFFYLVGLEIKRELLIGDLSGWKKASLPVVGAIGGMVGPALIFLALNAGTPYAVGWAIPMATDIAFAVGIVALLGSRVPTELKLFLLALAIVDDMGAVIVIAAFYTANLDAPLLALALGTWAVAMVYGLRGGSWAPVHLTLGGIVWVCMLKSGVHATIAGVLMALAMPVRPHLKEHEIGEHLQRRVGSLDNAGLRMDQLEAVVRLARSPLMYYEHLLAPWVRFGIMPVFALFNAGVAMGAGAVELGTGTLGVILGLVIGKPLGIAGLVWVAEKLGITQRPEGVPWKAMIGISLLAGIGFTMSLFIADLAFADPVMLDSVKIGVLIASVIAAIAGLLFLHLSLGRAEEPRQAFSSTAT